MRLLLATMVALCAVGLLPGIALADVDIFTKGTVGEHWVDDTPERGGAVCRYSGDGPWHLTSFKVRPPDVFAIDSTATRDAGRVGWRMLVDTYSPEPSKVSGAGGATIFYKSGVVRQTAYDDTPAAFRAIIASPSVPENDNEYRFFVKMNWYRPNGSLKGTSVHVLTQMRLEYGGTTEWRDGNCPGTIYPTV